MTFTEITNDEGFKKYCIDIVFDDCSFHTKKSFMGQWGSDWDEGFIEYYILYKTREAINKEAYYDGTKSHFFIELNLSVMKVVYGGEGFETVKIYGITEYNSEIEALAQALYFIYKEQK